jgi:uncharacterized protein YcbK (DUF882 family)
MTPHPSRRHFLHRSLRQAAGLAGAAGAPALLLHARAAAAAPRSISLVHTHTHESIDVCYARGEQYDAPALTSLNRFLRDHYSGEVGHIDPALHDLLHRLHQTVGSTEPYQVISGYRAPATNARLKATRGGGVATRSLHMTGQAIDVRLPGTALSDLRDAALSLQSGGVGYYPGSQFVHLDTGRVRRW